MPLIDEINTIETLCDLCSGITSDRYKSFPKLKERYHTFYAESREEKAAIIESFIDSEGPKFTGGTSALVNTSSKHQSPMVYAVQNANQPLIEVLLRKGADINRQAEGEPTALIMAIYHVRITNNLEIKRTCTTLVASLLEQGADPMLEGTISGRKYAPLEYAKQHNLPEVAKLLEARIQELVPPPPPPPVVEAPKPETITPKPPEVSWKTGRDKTRQPTKRPDTTVKIEPVRTTLVNPGLSQEEIVASLRRPSEEQFTTVAKPGERDRFARVDERNKPNRDR